MTVTREKQREYAANWKNKDPERARLVHERRFTKQYLSPDGRALVMLNNCRQRAKELGVEVTLDADWFLQRILAGRCEVTGVEISLKVGVGRKRRPHPFSPSVDRRDGTLGYTPENCRMTCWIYNHAKSAHGEEDVLRMARGLVARADGAQESDG